MKYLFLLFYLCVICSLLCAEESKSITSGIELKQNRIQPSFQLDNFDENYTEFLIQFQLYTQENSSCYCYFPVWLNGSWDIRKFSFYAFQDLVDERFGLCVEDYFQFYNISNQKYQEDDEKDWFKYIYKEKIYPKKVKRLYLALFKNAFFYSQYRAILLDFALYSESYPYCCSDLLTDGINATYSYLADLQDQFFALYSQCLLEHPHPKIYYERGMIHAHRGNWEHSIEDIKNAINLTAGSPLDNMLSSELFLQEGSYYAEQGLYDQAILALTEAIAKNPTNKEAYFERAIAYFEKMEFDLAISDYIASETKSSSAINENLFSIDYAKGLTKGIQKGIQHEFAETLPCWAPVMNLGLWALMNSPTPSAKFVAATLGCVAAVGVAFSADQVLTELKDLVTNWNKLSQEARGELTGFLIGKYGVDIFAAYGSAKCMDAYESLRKANNILTFELMLAEKPNRGLVAKKVAEQLSKRPKGNNIQAFNEGRVLKDKEKMKHLFADKHKLDKLGGPKEALEKITDAVFHADMQGKIPQSGAFEIVVAVDGHPVNVRGAIVNGELRYGTIFISE